MCPLLFLHVISCWVAGAVEEISKGCNISFKHYSCKNKCNICISTFTTLTLRYNPEKPNASVYKDRSMIVIQQIFFLPLQLSAEVPVHKDINCEPY